MARVFTRIKVDGLADAERALRALGPKVARRVLRRAVKAGGDRFKFAAQIKAPVDSGLLVSTIDSKVSASTKKQTVRARVGMKAGDFKGEAYYGSFIEYGTSRMPPQPYLRPAFDEQKDNALMIVRRRLAEGIETEAARLARQQARAAGGR